MNYTKNYIIRFTTKKSQYFGRYFRKIVGAKNLYKYVGEINANNALETLKKFKGERCKLYTESTADWKFGQNDKT